MSSVSKIQPDRQPVTCPIFNTTGIHYISSVELCPKLCLFLIIRIEWVIINGLLFFSQITGEHASL